MYGKKSGHTDWVSGVTHLADGRVASVGMDSKLCLWSADKRTCTEVNSTLTLTLTLTLSLILTLILTLTLGARS